MNPKVVLVLRILLGLIFTVFGLNFFLQFIPIPPGMPEDVNAFFQIFAVKTKYMTVVKCIEVAAGLMLLANVYMRVALLVLAPISVNILLFHLLVERGNPAMAIVILAINFTLLYSQKEHFRGVLQMR